MEVVKKRLLMYFEHEKAKDRDVLLLVAFDLLMLLLFLLLRLMRSMVCTK